MSKSRGNVVTPDEYIDRHGSDVLRCALLFSAPWEQGGDFQLDAIAGIERFFARVWRAVTAIVDGGGEGEDDIPAEVVAAVASAIERLHLNVGIARLMEAVTSVRSRRQADTFVRLLAPFAPHLAEELWARLGGSFSVHTADWPDGAPVDGGVRQVEVVVQVDGRVRDRVEMPAGATAGDVRSVALARRKVTEAVDGRAVARVVVVPDRLINVVTTAQSVS